MILLISSKTILLGLLLCLFGRTAIAAPADRDEARCSAGHNDACARAGIAYYKGSGVEQDKAHAAALFQKACERGLLPACGILGSQFEHGDGVPENLTRAAQLLRRACNGGIGEACSDLGLLALDGRGTHPDPKMAVHYLKKACDAGIAEGCFNLARRYVNGEGVEKDASTAASFLETACDGHVAQACNDLGIQYLNGEGVTLNEKTAAELFRKSCDSRLPLGCANLGLAYAKGSGVTKDEREAATLFEGACEAEVAGACFNAGIQLSNQATSAEQIARGRDFFQRACKLGDAQACSRTTTSSPSSPFSRPPSKARGWGIGEMIVALILVGFLLLILVGVVRILVSVVGLGRWACSKGWHWWRDFPVHMHHGFASRTTTYLAVAGVRVNQCRTCHLFNPPEGRVVHEQWSRGEIQKIGGGIFSGPELKASPTARAAIRTTLAPAMARAAATAAAKKPKSPPPQWMVRLGSAPLVQSKGRYLVVFGAIGGLIGVVGAIGTALDKDGASEDALVSLGAGVLGLATAYVVGTLMDAGSNRFIAKKLAAEAAQDPIGYHQRTEQLFRDAGLEPPQGVTPQDLAKAVQKKADES